MATENGPLGIYRVKPLYETNLDIDLPTCMYRLPNLQEISTTTSTTGEDIDKKMSDGPDDVSQSRLSCILKRLEDMKLEVLDLKKNATTSEKLEKKPTAVKFSCDVNRNFKPQEIVIKANPEYPPYSVWAFLYLLENSVKAQLVTYTHSSLKTLPDELKRLNGSRNDGNFDLTLTVIWKDIGKNPEMVVDPLRQGIIEAEVNIARYLSRILSSGYDDNPIEALQIDYWLEVAHSMLIHGSNKDRNAAIKLLNSHLAKSSYLLENNSLSLADVVMWSTLLQCKLHRDLPAHVDKWWKIISEIPMFHNIASF